MAAAPVKSYSLWVLPKGPLADKLHGEVKQLAARVPDAPTFLPHVTLLGGIKTSEADVLDRAGQLAARLKPYRISFDCTAYGAIFHQCVYVLCQRHADTMQAGAAAREAFGLDPSAAYMPHLSLLYSDIKEQHRKEITEEAQARLFGEQQGQGDGEGLLLPEERQFQVTSLTVWETEESDMSLLSWRQLAEYPLQGQ